MKKLFLISLYSALSLGTASAENKEQTKTIADFKTKKTSLKWRIVNDGVMGGLSRGTSVLTENDKLYFKGNISLKNNGGFSSTRTYQSKFNLKGYKGVKVRLKGDGRMYYFTSRANNKRMLAFWSPIQTKPDQWMTVKIPFDSFYATSFGRKIPGMKLNKNNITSFGLMLYDKKSGRFNIELDSIIAYK